LAPGQISLRAVPALHLLTSAPSQVKFDVSTNVFVFNLVGGLSMPTCHSVHWHAWSSMYIYGCSIHKVSLIRRTNSKFPFSSNNYARMHGCMTYCQFSLYIWSLDQTPAPTCPWWQSSFLGTLNCKSLDWHLLSRCWFTFPKSYIDFSLPKPYRFAVREHSTVVCWYSAFLLNSLKVDGIASPHSPCTIPCTLWLHHNISLNTQVHLSVEQECRYPIPPWVYPW
jgi:hypothetical protein